MFGAHYLENGWRYRFSYDGAPIGNGIWVSNGHMLDDVTCPCKYYIIMQVLTINGRGKGRVKKKQ